jgi:uncharacterized protein DUF3592
MMVASLSLILTVCIGGGIALIGAGLLIFGWSQSRKGNSAQNWPITTGTIVSADLSQQSRRNQQGYHDVTYAPVVEYTYEVNGQTYRGDKISSGWTVSYNLSMAQNKMNKYPPGTKVDVHYNPNNPAEAVLETRSTSGNVFMIAGGAILVPALGAGCCVVGFSLFTNGVMNQIMNNFK